MDKYKEGQKVLVVLNNGIYGSSVIMGIIVPQELYGCGWYTVRYEGGNIGAVYEPAIIPIPENVTSDQLEMLRNLYTYVPNP